MGLSSFRTRCRHCREVFFAMNPALPCPACGKLSGDLKEGEEPFSRDALKLAGVAVIAFIVISGIVGVAMFWQ